MRMMNRMRRTDRRLWAGLALLLGLAGMHLAHSDDARAAGHSWYSYKAGKNCQGTKNIVDPVGIIVITHSSVGDIASLTQSRSFTMSALDNDVKRWTHGNWVDDIKGQQGAYYRGSTRVCSSFNDQNATGGATDSRYHVRWHTGGPSSSNVGYNVVAGTPHYDKLCGTFPPKHEIWTFAGARTQFAKVYPKSEYPGQYIKYVGNSHSRHFNCLNKDTANDGYALFIFAEAD
jgi:hypothetical protein